MTHAESPGVDAGLLDVLHDADHVDVGAVGEHVHVDFGGVLQEFINEDGVFRTFRNLFVKVIGEFLSVINGGHGAAAEHVARAYHDGISDAFGHLYGLIEALGCSVFGLSEAKLVNEGLEAFPVLGTVNGVGGGAQNFHARAHERYGQIEGGRPPNWTMTPSGFSFSMMFITSSNVRGSKKSLSEVS